VREWIGAQRSLAARQPRRYATLDEAYERMLEANPQLSAQQARHLTIHGANRNEDGTYTWKLDNYTHTGRRPSTFLARRCVTSGGTSPARSC
jgi:hypothetical protein